MDLCERNTYELGTHLETLYCVNYAMLSLQAEKKTFTKYIFDETEKKCGIKIKNTYREKEETAAECYDNSAHNDAGKYVNID